MISGNLLSRNSFKIKKILFRTMQKTMHFWELSDSARFILEEQFCKELAEKASNGNYYALAEKLGVSYPFVICLKRSEYSIPKKILVKLSELANLNLELVEKNIKEIKTRAGLSLKTKLPITGNEDIASLVGHVFGDGFVCSRRRQFEYSNTNSLLLCEVEELVEKQFGIKPYTKNNTRIGYPSIIGEILLQFGAPQAPKIYNKNLVPAWIMNGSKPCKKAFLKAIFDDDGSVMYSKSFRAKGVNLYQTRHESIADSLRMLLSQIKELLKEFDINAGEPLISRYYTKVDGRHCVMYLNITDQYSITNFYKNIGLCSGKKFLKLEKLATKATKYTKHEENRFRQKIIECLKRNSASTSGIANELNFSVQKTLKKLKQLEVKNLVEQIGKTAPNRAIIWKIKEVTAY